MNPSAFATFSEVTVTFVPFGYAARYTESIVNDYNLTQYDSCMKSGQSNTNSSYTTPVGAGNTPTGGTTYTVVVGDNLTKIAKRFGTTVDAIYV